MATHASPATVPAGQLDLFQARRPLHDLQTLKPGDVLVLRGNRHDVTVEFRFAKRNGTLMFAANGSLYPMAPTEALARLERVQ